jgi:hypothetical protein
MKIDQLSIPTQDALRSWAKEVMGDKLHLDGIDTRGWAWIAHCLRVSEDRPEHFPKGKWATIQFIEDILDCEAHREIHGKGHRWERARS